MANIITAQRTYATVENAEKALAKALTGSTDIRMVRTDIRWLIAVTPDGKRFVPTLVGAEYIGYAHAGIMVIG